MQLRHFVEVEVVGHDLTEVDLGQFNQLHVHFRNGGEIVFKNRHVQLRHLLDTLQDVQAAAAAIALERIGRIGHQLQFAQYKLRDHQCAVQEPGFDDVGNAPVDNYAGIKDLKRLARRLLAAEQSAQRPQIQHVALACADHKADVAQTEQQHNLKERNCRRSSGVRVSEH